MSKGPVLGPVRRDFEVDVARSKFVEEQVPLRPDETILWSGRPDPARMGRQGIRKAVYGLILLAIVGGTFISVASEGLAQIETAVWVILLPVGLLSLWMLETPFRYSRRARRVRYVVTDRNIMIVKGGRRGTISMVVRHRGYSIDGMDVVTNAAGTGYIRFPKPAVDRTHVMWRQETGMLYMLASAATEEIDYGLWGLHDVDAAVDAIEQLRQSPNLDLKDPRDLF